MSVLEPPAVKGPFKLGLGVDDFGQNRRVSLNICFVKLLDPFHYLGDGETLLMMTDSLKIRLNFI